MASGLVTTAWPDRLRFISRFVRNPGRVGSIAPSSRHLASAVVAAIQRPTNATRGLTIVELGAGTGAFTRAIVDQLRPADRFVSVELEAAFVAILRRRWPDVDFACASATSLCALLADREFGPVDHIVSGLPFATLPAGTTRDIVAAIAQSIRPGGTFTTFHYLHSYAVPPAAAFRRQMQDAFGSTPSIEFVGWNLPPALALTWTYQAANFV